MKNILRILSTSAVFLLLFSTLVAFAASPVFVLSDQKVSDTAGSFGGTIDDTDNFGRSVANIGDLDSDGVNDLVVGAIYDDDGGTDRGAVYVLFMNADGTVSSYQKISNTVGGFTGTLDDSDTFGTSVAGIGDLDSDGTLDIAVGAPGDDDGGTDRGAVYILFMNTNGTVSSHQKISNTDGTFTGVLENSDALGTSVAGIGNLNGAGGRDIAVGAILDNDGGSGRGAVYIMFLNVDGTVASHQKISDTEGSFTATLSDFDSFGMSVANMGDLNSDSVNDLAVGASFDGVSNYGAVYILFMNTGGTVSSYQKINDTEGNLGATFEADDRFGTGVANIGDIDGDGINDLAVGAYFDNDGGSNRGAVYALQLNSSGAVKGYNVISDTQGNFTETIDNNDYLGFGISEVGDLNNDGVLDIVAGAPNDDDGGSDRGAIYSMFMDIGYTVSGILYSDQGVSPVVGEDVTVMVNGVEEGTDATDASGVYTLSGVNLSAGDVVTAFLDGDGTPNYAVTVTVADDADITNLDLYHDHLITRHEDAGPITNTDLDLGNSGHADIIPVYPDGGTTSLDLARNLYIPSGHTFEPGGMINIAGNWNNFGTLSPGTSTVVFDGSFQSINGSSTFNNFSKIAAAAETLTFQNGQTQTIGGVLTLDGDVGKEISIDSDVGGSAGIVNVTGTYGTIDHLSILDSTLKENGAIKDPALNLVNTTFSTTSTLVDNANGWITLQVLYDPANLIESSANLGAIGNNPITIDLGGDTFVADVLTAPGYVTVSNVPGGLTANLSLVSDQQLTLSIDGQANNHANANSISNLTVTFVDAAFTTYTAAELTDSVKTDLQITFNDGSAGSPTITLLAGYINEDEPEDEPDDEPDDEEEEPADEEEPVEEEEPADEEEPVVEQEPVVEPEPELPVAPVLEAIVPDEAPVEEAPAEEEGEGEAENEDGGDEPVVQSGESLPDEVKSAISSYVEGGGSSRPAGPSGEEVLEEQGEELADDNDNGVDDRLEKIETGEEEVEYGDQDFDNDGFTIAEEFFCDYDLTEADVAETKVPFLGDNVYTGNNILIHLCSAIEGDSIEISIVTEDLEELFQLGEVEVDGSMGVLKIPEEVVPYLENGKKYVVIPVGEYAGLGVLTSFTVDNDIVPQAPPIEFQIDDVSDFIREIITYAGQTNGFDGRVLIISKQLESMEGSIKTDPYLTVYFAYQSRVYSSVVLADASGEIDIKMPNKLQQDILVQAPQTDEPIEHEILVYAVDKQNNFIGNVSTLIFSLQ